MAKLPKNIEVLPVSAGGQNILAEIIALGLSAVTIAPTQTIMLIVIWIKALAQYEL